MQKNKAKRFSPKRWAEIIKARARYYRTIYKARARGKLSWSRGNAKVDKKTTALLSLPAGHACPGAFQCLAYVLAGKLIDGTKATVRCFAASAEALFPNVHESRQRNFRLLKEARTVREIVRQLEYGLPRKPYLRPGGSGDYFSRNYFIAWILVARRNPDRLIYSYTKSLPFWVEFKDRIPRNFRLIASRGGKWDSLIYEHGLPCAEIVYSKAEAREKGLPLDHTEKHARQGDHSFALLIHGNGRPGSLQAKLQAQGGNGYRSDYFAHYRNKEKAN